MPRRTTSKPPKYRLHRARNLAVVTVDGKDHYLGPFGSPESHERYAQIIARWKQPAQMPIGKVPAPALSIGELTLR